MVQEPVMINPALLYHYGWRLLLSRMKVHSWSELNSKLPRTGLNAHSLFGGSDVVCRHYTADAFGLRDLMRRESIPDVYYSDIQEFKVDQIDKVDGTDVDSSEQKDWNLTDHDLQELALLNKQQYDSVSEARREDLIERRMLLPRATVASPGKYPIRAFVFVALRGIDTPEDLKLARGYLRTDLFTKWWSSIRGLYWSSPYARFHCVTELVSDGLRPIVELVTKDLHRSYPKGVETATHIVIEELASGSVDVDALFTMLGQKLQAYAPVAIDEALAVGAEGPRVEFKSSLRWDYKQGNVNAELLRAVVKGISAFLNTEGGMMLIGVDDAGTILGLEPDYQSTSKKNRDGFRLTLIQGIEDLLGPEHTAHVKIDFSDRNDKEVCIVSVHKGAKPAYLKGRSGKDQEFYIRADNSSRKLDLESTIGYIRMQWPHLS